MDTEQQREHLAELQRQGERLSLKLKMYEQQAINDGPDMFDYWADRTDQTKKEIDAKGLEVMFARMALVKAEDECMKSYIQRTGD